MEGQRGWKWRLEKKHTKKRGWKGRGQRRDDGLQKEGEDYGKCRYGEGEIRNAQKK